MKAYEGEYNIFQIKDQAKSSPFIETDAAKIESELEKNKALTSLKKREATAARAKSRENIKKLVNDIANRLIKPSDKKHIQTQYSDMAATIVDLIEFDGAERETKEGENWRLKKEKIEELITKAKAIDINSDEYYGFDPAFRSRIESLAESIGDKAYLRDLTLEQTKELESVINSFKKMTTEADEDHAFRRKGKISERAKKAIDDLVRRKQANFLSRSYINYGFMDAFSMLEKIGDAGKELSRALSDAQGKEAKSMRSLEKFMSETAPAKKIIKLRNKRARLKLEAGEYEFTTPQLMEIYELSKRSTAEKHLLDGGIAIKKEGVFERNKAPDVIKLTESDLKTIENALSTEEKGIADKLQQHMATVGAKLGNEVTNELYGYDRYKVGGDYYTMKALDGTFETTDVNVNEKNGNFGLYSLKNSGFTKQVTKGAANPLMISDIFNTYSIHMARMSAYNAYVPILTDLMRILNYKDASSGVSFKKTLDNTLGTRASAFFEENIIKALNGAGTQNNGYDAKVINKLYANAKAAAVGGNLRVAIQQPTAYLRAAVEIDPKYLAQALYRDGDIGSKSEKLERMYEFAPITLIKQWGRADINTGRSATAIILGSVDTMERIKDVTMWGASKADDLTWRRLWNACLLETAEKTNLKKYSKEFYAYAGDRFTDIVNKTQVVDTPLHRVAMMKGDNLLKLSTQFMAEPLKTLNVYRRALEGFQVDNKTGIDKLLRAGAAMTMTAAVNAVAQSIMDAFRDSNDRDDEGKKRTWIDKFTESWGENFFSNANVLEQIPFIKDIWGIAKGQYSNNSPLYFRGIDKAIKAFNKIGAMITGEEEADPYDVLYTASEAVSYLTGIAFSNVFRDAKGFYNTFVPEEKKITDTYYKDHHTQKDTVDEIVNLFMVGYEDVLKKDAPPKTMTGHDGEEITLTKEQKQNYRDSYNVTYGTIASMLNDLDIWKDMPEEQRANAYEAVKRKAAQEAKYSIIGYPKDEYGDEVKKSMEEYAEDCIYYGLTKGMSKREEKVDAIEKALGVTHEEALYMYYKYGSHLSDNEALKAARKADVDILDDAEREKNAKAAGLSLKEYDNYMTQLGKIEGIKADDGQTISGSTYANKLSYIVKQTSDEKTAVYLAKIMAPDTDREALKEAEKANILNKDFLQMYSAYKLLEAQQDANGETVNGSKKAKQLEYISKRCSKEQAKVILTCIASNEDQKLIMRLVNSSDIDVREFAHHYSQCVTYTNSDKINEYLASIAAQTNEVHRDLLYLLTSKTKKEYNERLIRMLKNIKGPKADDKYEARVLLYRD